MTRKLLVGAMLLLWPVLVAAQTVINPTHVEFMVSADHAVVISGVGALVESYEARWYAAGATAPQQTSNLGKPTPDATGKATVDVSTVIVAFPISPTTTYTAKLVAMGVGGVSPESAPSNPFLRVVVRAPGVVTVVRR